MSDSVRNINQQFWSSKRIPHLVIRTTYGSTQGYKAHSHSELSIGVIESGTTCLSMEGKDILLSEGDVILIEPHVVHSCNPVDGKARSYHMLYIDESWCCEVLSALYERKVEQITCDQNLLFEQDLGEKFSFLINALLKDEAQEHASQIDNLLFNMLNLHCSPTFDEVSNSDLAYQIKDRLLDNIVSSPSIDDISQELARSKESIIRSFKRCFGITPKSFLNNSRIEKAKFLLRAGMNIVDVATEVGYSDQSQLHRAFVNYTASTPRQYQQVKSIFDNNS